MSNTRWTPDLVAERLEYALRVTLLSERRVGPAGFLSSMPQVLRETRDEFVAGGAAFSKAVKDRLDEIEQAGARRFSADQMTEAERVTAWPRAHLVDEFDRDAVWLVLMGRVTLLNVERVLKRRRERADAMIERRDPDAVQPDTIRIYEDDAADAAAKITVWANAAMAEPVRQDLVDKARARKRAAITKATGRRPKRLPELTPDELAAVKTERDERIKRAAKTRMARAAREGMFVERIPAPRSPVKRSEVMPGRNFNVEPLYRRFNAALESIAAALAED